MIRKIIVLFVFVMLDVQMAPGEDGPPVSVTASTSDSICLIIESAARTNRLPVNFFVRIIWQESRFQANAIGPRTRSGDRAQGIAQFMPRTAAERGLLDPFDPIQALPKSAEFLAELRREFGNLGLAAAAYNAGPQRVRDYLAGGGLPAETRSYVTAVTGIGIEDWRQSTDKDIHDGVRQNCEQVVARLKSAPNLFVRKLEERVALVAAAPWGVQLSAGFSREQALRSYASVASRNSSILEGRDPIVLATRLLSRGPRIFYQVRVGAETRSLAERLCGQFRREGGACLVLRNRL